VARTALQQRALRSRFQGLALNSGRVEMVDNPRLVAQICSLERRTARGGRDSVDHPAGSAHHDDIANAALGLAALCFNTSSVGYPLETWIAVNGGAPANRAAEEIERAKRVHPHYQLGRVDLGDGGYWLPSISEQWRLALEAAEAARNRAKAAEKNGKLP
jgi:hypothetical protein